MRINVNDTSAVQAALDAHQARARTRRASVEGIASACAMAESHLLAAGVPKYAWRGCVICMLPPRTAYAYKHTPLGTKVVLERGSNAWFVTLVFRVYAGKCRYGEVYGRVRLVLSNTASAAIPTVYTL